MIPSLNEIGLLPPGEHPATWDELQAWMAAHAYSARRLELLDRLRRVCDDELRTIYAGWPLIVAGSCFSDKEKPGDIECTLDVRAADESLRQRATLHWLQRHDTIKQFEVDYYPSLSEDWNLRRYFGYLGPKSAALKSLDERDPRGTVLLSHW